MKKATKEDSPLGFGFGQVTSDSSGVWVGRGVWVVVGASVDVWVGCGVWVGAGCDPGDPHPANAARQNRMRHKRLNVGTIFLP